MKHTVPALLALLVSAAAALADPFPIGTVDLASLIQSHPRTEENKKVLNALKDDYEARRDEKIAALNKLREEAEDAVEKSKNEALSDTARFAARETAKSKLTQLQKDEAALRDFVDDLQKDLSKAEMARLNETLADIRASVDAEAKERGLALVLDSSRSPIGGYSPVLYSDSFIDITPAVEKRIQAAAPAPAAETKE